MKKIRWAIVLFLSGCCLAIFAGCAPALESPTDVSVDNVELVLTWSPVDNATYYVVGINDAEYITSRTSYSLSSLDAGEYELRVKACDARRELRDSAWSDTVAFVMENVGGLSLTAINANTAYEVTGYGSARGDVVIPDTYRGLPVVSIGERAFYSCGVITSVTIGSNVTSIGDSAFMNCSSLTSVVIPDSVTYIGTNAFQSCRALTEVVLPAGLTQINDYTFRYCRNLTSVTFGQALTSIGQMAFGDCESLTAVTIPDSVTSIGQEAFINCDQLASIDLGSGVTQLSDSAFSACTALASVTGGESLQTIGEYVFYRCEQLAAFSFPEQVVSIGAYAFSGCTALADVTLGVNVTSVCEGAFNGTPLAEQYVDGIAYADNWAIGNDGSFTSSSTPGFRAGTVGIADNAFYESEIQNVSFPVSVRYVGDYAFYNCDNLTTLDLGDGVVSIGRYSFAECDILGRGRISLGGSLQTIGSYAFYNDSDFGNPSLGGSVSIPDSVTSIGTYAFNHTYAWSSKSSGIVYLGKWVVVYVEWEETQPSITVRTGIIGIANYAFYDCTSVSSITLPHTLETIGMAAFYGCSNLTSVLINVFEEDSRLREIGDYAFYRCENLTRFEVTNADYPMQQLETIGRSAFYRSGLTSIEIPGSVKEIGPYAFYNCPQLTQVTFAEGNSLETIGMYAFAYCSALTAVELPDSVTTIENRAFSQCRALETLSLSDSLTSLGEYAFYYCIALKEIELPDSLTAVSGRAFYRCSALTSVRFGNELERIGEYAFYGCNMLTTLDFPASLREIGAYAFRSCSALTSVVLGSHIETIGIHAFNGPKNLTLYCEAEGPATGWDARWNSGYRPVVWNCTLSEDGKYVVSFLKTTDGILNSDATNGISAPLREGYVFSGWSAQTETGEVIYSLAELEEIPDGTVLTAVWTPAPEETPEIPADGEDAGTQSQL